MFAEFGAYVSANASPATSTNSAKQDFVNVDGTNQGFDLIGWSPEGRVYFTYGVAISGTAFTASASADIDADTTFQIWGYRKGSVNGKTHNGSPSVCTFAQLTSAETVMACAAGNGRSIF